MLSNDHSSLIFRAHSARLIVDLSRQAVGIEAMDANGTSLILELAGAGPATLKSELEALFRKHPEMADWKSPLRN